MEMNKRTVPSILLMLSLGAALLDAGHASAAADEGAILLPSQEGEDRKPRPWKCCDKTICTWSTTTNTPTCTCEDVVDNCAPTCTACNGYKHPPRRVCLDQYTGDPGPRCTNAGAGGN